MAEISEKKKHAINSLAVPRSRKALSHVKTPRRQSSYTVKFGSVSVVVTSSSNAEIKRNIKAGQVALSRVKNWFLKPGVKLASVTGVPLFSVDPRDPSLLIRKLKGKETRGVLRNGRFKVLAE